MEKILICIPSHNTLSRGVHVLERTIRSLDEAIKYAKNQYPDLEIFVSWVDDASNDNTPLEVMHIFNMFDIPNSLMTALENKKGPAFCRNLAASLIDSDYITFFDSDDIMHPEHLAELYKIMTLRNEKGLSYGIGMTKLQFDPEIEIHESWFPNVEKHTSLYVPFTKIIRREVWEFLEGFPEEHLYNITGSEDHDFAWILLEFFQLGFSEKQTVLYCNYPGSFLDKKRPMFANDVKEYKKHLFQNGFNEKLDKKRLELYKKRRKYIMKKTKSKYKQNLEKVLKNF